MRSELQALEDNNTWALMPLPTGKTPINCRWIYNVKHRADGSIERYKARLFTKGFTKLEGLRRQGENLVCRLNKSLYGLKQASRQWFAKFTEAIQSAGYTQSKADYSLFTRKQGKSFIALLIYVDDKIITGNDPVAISSSKSFLNSHFSIKDLGELKYFLGIEVSLSKNGIFVSQRKYALKIISDAGLLGAAPIDTPMERGLKLSDKGALLTDSARYRRLVGRLIYLTISRPDITYVVHVLSRFMHEPPKSHMEAAQQVVRNFKRTSEQGEN